MVSFSTIAVHLASVKPRGLQAWRVICVAFGGHMPVVRSAFRAHYYHHNESAPGSLKMSGLRLQNFPSSLCHSYGRQGRLMVTNTSRDKLARQSTVHFYILVFTGGRSHRHTRFGPCPADCGKMCCRTCHRAYFRPGLRPAIRPLGFGRRLNGYIRPRRTRLEQCCDQCMRLEAPCACVSLRGTCF
jgi:hypothetical protein